MAGQEQLSVIDHRRDRAARRYVYPVVSRRAGGVSVGVNLSPNQACNWRCRYCQVPGLVRGAAPAIDLELLASELGSMLDEIVHGDFMDRQVPPEARRLNDVALSGNGEPTSSPSFAAVVDVVLRCLRAAGLLDHIKIVLITNGSLVRGSAVRAALERMAAHQGEIWFKLDAATDAGLAATNGFRGRVSTHLGRLAEAARRCPTWVQSCMFEIDGSPPAVDATNEYLAALARLHADGVRLEGVQLYSLARPVMQPDAARLGPVRAGWLESLGRRIEAIGYRVAVLCPAAE